MILFTRSEDPTIIRNINDFAKGTTYCSLLLIWLNKNLQTKSYIAHICMDVLVRWMSLLTNYDVPTSIVWYFSAYEVHGSTSSTLHNMLQISLTIHSFLTIKML